MDEGFEMPVKPFFSCDADGFAIVDGQTMRNAWEISSIEPLIKFKVGPGNAFESRPVKVLEHDADLVSVECEDGSIVHLDFADLAVRVQREEGEYRYMGGIDEGNDGRGFLSPR